MDLRVVMMKNLKGTKKRDITMEVKTVIWDHKEVRVTNKVNSWDKFMIWLGNRRGYNQLDHKGHSFNGQCLSNKFNPDLDNLNSFKDRCHNKLNNHHNINTLHLKNQCKVKRVDHEYHWVLHEGITERW